MHENFHNKIKTMNERRPIEDYCLHMYFHPNNGISSKFRLFHVYYIIRYYYP